jgi:hypothetical protein
LNRTTEDHSSAATATSALPPPRARIEAVDFARGVAVSLMILSHGANGLLPLDAFPSWGQVPVHALTRFSSSLFVMVFGVALAIAYVPKTGATDWPRRRLKLLLTGLVVLFWYKVLTIVEMLHLHAPADIVDALLYRRFPSYVEILGFYAIALLWIPFVLPLWARLPLVARWASPVLVGLLCWLLLERFDFWGSETLQALLVEHPDHHTWGQLARGPLVLVGLLIGGMILSYYPESRTRRLLAAGLAGAGMLSLLLFAFLVRNDFYDALLAIAWNEGKHPPELRFMLYSVGGALLLLGLAVLGGERLAHRLRPVTIVGSDALMAFIFHISVIFVIFRFLLGWFHAVSYEFALVCTIALIPATAAWISLIRWIKRRRRS